MYLSPSVENAEPPVITPGPPRAVVGDGLTLRPWQLDQVDALMDCARDALIGQWNPIAARDASEARQSIEAANTWTDHCTWAVMSDSDDVLGGISLFHLDAANASGELGYWVAPGARGQGVAARAVAAVCAFAFGELPLQRLELFHAVENTPSCAAATKAGFLVEGTLRRSYRYSDGILHDEHLHARLCDD